MPLRIAFFSLLLTLILAPGCKKDRPEIDNVKDFKRYVLEEMDRQNIPAIAILSFQGNTILQENYFGKTNIAQSIDLAPDHVFLLASISKTITATALLQLHEAGHFQLDDKINDHLPFQVKIPNSQTDITFRMLLTHTSGIADGPALNGQYYYGQDSPIALSDFLRDYLVPGRQHYDAIRNFHDFEPGTEHEYSNIGAALIGALVAEISGMDFNAYCKQNIFGPLGMSSSFWRLDEIQQPIVQPYNLSRGRLEAIDHYTFTDYPNGGLRTTARDLFRFFSTLAQGGAYNGFELLKPATVRMILTPQIPSIDPDVGLHMFVMNSSENLWGHNGGEQGVATIAVFHPNTQKGVIVLSNQGDAKLDQIMLEAYKL